MAIERAECILVRRKEFFSLFESHPSLVRGFLTGMAQRIVELPPEVVIDGRVLVRGFGVSDFGPTMAEGIDVFGAAS